MKKIKFSFNVKQILIILLFCSSILFAENRIRIDKDGQIIDSTERFAIGILKAEKVEDKIYRNKKAITGYKLNPIYSQSWGFNSSGKKSELSILLDNLVVVEGYNKWFNLNELKEYNGTLLSSYLTRAHYQIFDIAKVYPATIKDDITVITINPPDKIVDKGTKCLISLKNPFQVPIKKLEIFINIKQIGKRINIQKNSKDKYAQNLPYKHFIFSKVKSSINANIVLVKDENDIILEKTNIKSIYNTKINVKYVGYVIKTKVSTPISGYSGQQIIKEIAVVITNEKTFYYAVKYIGIFHITTGAKNPYGAKIKCSFGEIDVSKRYLEKFKDLKKYNGEKVIFSATLNSRALPTIPYVVTSFDSIKLYK